MVLGTSLGWVRDGREFGSGTWASATAACFSMAYDLPFSGTGAPYGL